MKTVTQIITYSIVNLLCSGDGFYTSLSLSNYISLVNLANVLKCFLIRLVLLIDQTSVLDTADMYICTYVCMYVRTYVRTYVFMYVCVCVCMYVRMYICMCFYVLYTCVWMYMYVCMSAWNNLASTGWIFVKFNIGGFFESVSRKLILIKIRQK